MSLSAVRTSVFRTARLQTVAKMSIAARFKHTLPELAYPYNALEPAISEEIMKIHHTKHHNTYVTNLNAAEEKLEAAVKSNDVASQIALQAALKFNGGGHLNHTLFWENLAPASQGGGKPPTGALADAINQQWGNVDNFIQKFNAALAGIQGSGWGWLIKDKETGKLAIITTPNQDPVVGNQVPLIGIDTWEHAYYLQYQNNKVEYYKQIWSVINWQAAEKRFSA
ncbi:Superoxide dismutase [Mn], mitochondrial [Saitoella coloradoensis]